MLCIISYVKVNPFSDEVGLGLHDAQGLEESLVLALGIALHIRSPVYQSSLGNGLRFCLEITFVGLEPSNLDT